MRDHLKRVGDSNSRSITSGEAYFKYVIRLCGSDSMGRADGSMRESRLLPEAVIIEDIGVDVCTGRLLCSLVNNNGDDKLNRWIERAIGVGVEVDYVFVDGHSRENVQFRMACRINAATPDVGVMVDDTLTEPDEEDYSRAYGWVFDAGIKGGTNVDWFPEG